MDYVGVGCVHASHFMVLVSNCDVITQASYMGYEDLLTFSHLVRCDIGQVSF